MGFVVVVWRIFFLEMPFLDWVTMEWVLAGEGGGSIEEDEVLGRGKGGSGKAEGRMGAVGSLGSLVSLVSTGWMRDSGKQGIGPWAVGEGFNKEMGGCGLGLRLEIVDE